MARSGPAEIHRQDRYGLNYTMVALSSGGVEKRYEESEETNGVWKRRRVKENENVISVSETPMGQ